MWFPYQLRSDYGGYHNVKVEISKPCLDETRLDIAYIFAQPNGLTKCNHLLGYQLAFGIREKC